jgi:hypothetical protein
MARLAECRDCGAAVSRKAKACPACGRRKPAKKTGLLTWIALVFVALFLVSALNAPRGGRSGGGTPAPSPGPSATAAAPAGAALHAGDPARLDLPGANVVWLATTDDDWDALLDAENIGAKGGPGSLAPISRLAEAGRARCYANGTPVIVRKTAFMSIFVEIAEGEDAGRSGWVQREFVKPR